MDRVADQLQYYCVMETSFYKELEGAELVSEGSNAVAIALASRDICSVSSFLKRGGFMQKTLPSGPVNSPIPLEPPAPAPVPCILSVSVRPPTHSELAFFFWFAPSKMHLKNKMALRIRAFSAYPAQQL